MAPFSGWRCRVAGNSHGRGHHDENARDGGRSRRQFWSLVGKSEISDDTLWPSDFTMWLNNRYDVIDDH